MSVILAKPELALQVYTSEFLVLDDKKDHNVSILTNSVCVQ